MTRKHLYVASLFLTLPAAAAAPGWIVSCAYSHSLNDDPIVFFNQPGASHLHDFAGSRGTRANSTPDQLRAAGSTCAIAGDTTGYWTPRLRVRGTQELVPMASGDKDALFYYRRKAAPTGYVVPLIPDGLKMVLGNSHANSPAENPLLGSRIIWKCGPGSGTNLNHPPAVCDSGVMVLSFTFPNCWDGKNLDSPDHLSHMAYPAGSRCPTSHPVSLPRIESFWRYNVGKGVPIGTVELSTHEETGVWGPWYRAHSDVFNAWVPEALQSLMDRCINANRDCGVNPQ